MDFAKIAPLHVLISIRTWLIHEPQHIALSRNETIGAQYPKVGRKHQYETNDY